VRYPRTAGQRPAPEDNPLGAWYVRTRIEGAPGGPLSGRTVAVKDNICVVGVPMMNGTSALDGYVPDADATVVERLATGWKGRYTTSLMDHFARGRLDGDRLSETVKLTLLAGEWMQRAHHGRYYAKAQNLARTATAAYDEVMADRDLLVMPTLPLKATAIPPSDAPLEEYVARALEMIPNTAPFDVAGHPAMNVPCGMSDGLPIGMMLVGRHGEDATVLRAADAFELGVFRPPPPSA
jgi:Asp-tRNA(Asn)/Glu-tRNA(Gln) amidotransferase A subunit family amidase